MFFKIPSSILAKYILLLGLGAMSLQTDLVHAECVDLDGDGYGMNGNRPCRTRRTRSNQDVNSLRISNHRATEVSEESIMMIATFTKKASAKIKFGKTGELKQSGPYSGFLKRSIFTQVLKNLEPNTRYFYRIEARDQQGNLASVDGEFRTLASSIATTTTQPLSTTTTKIAVVTTTTTKPRLLGEPFPAISKTNSVAWNSGNHVANRPKPALRVWEDGDVPGTQIMRVSDKSGDGVHLYNTKQAWNADMTKMMVGNGGLDANRLLDATNNYALLPRRVPLTYDRVWSNVDPNLIYGIMAPKDKFVSFNVNTGAIDILYTRVGSTISLRGKGTLPIDDSRVLFYEPSTNKLISFDIKTRSVIAEMVWPHGNLDQGGGYLTFDWSGDWVTVKIGSDSQGRIYRMKADLSGLVQVDKNGGHSDCAYNSDGESVRVSTRGNGSVMVTNYDNPSKNYFSPVFGGADPVVSAGNRYTPSYVSGQGQSGTPGWVAFAGETGSGGSSPNHPIGFYFVDGNTSKATIKVIGWDHHSGGNSLSRGENDDKQKPTVSPDGRMVAFTSDWGVLNGEISTYVIREK